MRVLLDACVPRRLDRELEPHHVSTVPAVGWSDLDDGPLLEAIDAQFDVLITVDKSLPKQQRLDSRDFGVIVLRAPSNRLADLMPLRGEILAALDQVQPGKVQSVGA